MHKILPAHRGSLYRRLAIPLSGFVLVASLLMAVWIARLYRADSFVAF